MYPDSFVARRDEYCDYLGELDIPLRGEPSELLLTAFVHTSYAADQKDHLIDNQRLEFLGDAILGAVVSQLLYARFTTQPESKLTLYKIYLVKEQTLAQAARAIGLGKKIMLGHGEAKSGGSDKDAILADTLEALIGYLYLEHGRDAVATLVKKYIFVLLDQPDELPGKSYKNRLQELVQQHRKIIPDYRDEVVEEEPSGNVVLFGSSVWIDEKQRGYATGPSKKKAQEASAKKAYRALCEYLGV